MENKKNYLLRTVGNYRKGYNNYAHVEDIDKINEKIWEDLKKIKQKITELKIQI